MEPTILSFSIRWNAELMIGSSDCHRAWVGDQTRAADVRKILDSERWDADRILGMRVVPWPQDGSDNAFDIQVGMETPAEMAPRGRTFADQTLISVVCGN